MLKCQTNHDNRSIIHSEKFAMSGSHLGPIDGSYCKRIAVGTRNASSLVFLVCLTMSLEKIFKGFMVI